MNGIYGNGTTASDNARCRCGHRKGLHWLNDFEDVDIRTHCGICDCTRYIKSVLRLNERESVTPELMYKMVDHLAFDFHSLLAWLR